MASSGRCATRRMNMGRRPRLANTENKVTIDVAAMLAELTMRPSQTVPLLRLAVDLFVARFSLVRARQFLGSEISAPDAIWPVACGPAELMPESDR